MLAASTAAEPGLCTGQMEQSRWALQFPSSLGQQRTAAAVGGRKGFGRGGVEGDYYRIWRL